ncbi:MAG: ADP-ribosylation factor-like protein [Promethearchaeota archaeon]|jgi:small GTP-binding protein
MLRQVFVLKGNEIIYKRVYGSALKNSDIENISFKMITEAKKMLGKTTGYFDYFQYRVAYDVDLEHRISIIFITGLIDDFYSVIKTQLLNFKKYFFDCFEEKLKEKSLSNLDFKRLNVKLDDMHRNLKPKIAVVGFAGVGKTTIKKLIKMDEIPLQHVPTISGDIATIKIGKLFFRLFDFAGQEQFKFLWKKFIKESDAVLIVTDSTIRNVEKSSYFLDLKNKEVFHARAAVIANKQDLPNSLSISEIEEIIGLPTYPMIANRKENRSKMIRIIADVLDMSTEVSPLLAELFENTDLSHETLFGIGEPPLIEESPSIETLEVNSTLAQIEEIDDLQTTEERIDTIISISNEIKPVVFYSGKPKDEIRIPIEDGIINTDLYERIAKDNSFTENEILSIIFTIANCVYLSKTNPEKYPKFSSYLSSFKMDVFNAKELKLIKKHYRKIIKSIT